MGVCGSKAAAPAGDGPPRERPEQALQQAGAAERQRLRRSQADDDEAMEQAIALSLAMAGGGAAAAEPAAAVARPTTAGGRERIETGMLLHVFWDPAWDASESAVRAGGTAYWSGAVMSVLGPSEWISAHQDPEEDSHSERQVRARILRNHPALLDPAAWEARSYLGLNLALGGGDMTLGVPEDARMGPGVAGMAAVGPAGPLTRRTSRAAMAIDTRTGDLKGMVAAHVRQCGSTTGAVKHTIGKRPTNPHPLCLMPGACLTVDWVVLDSR